MRSHSGFTLIELMIACAIVAILAAVALASYNSSIVKTRRRAAEACLSNYATYMERYYTTNLTYSGVTTDILHNGLNLDCATAANTGNYYVYSFATGSPTASTYVLQAVPQGNQATSDTQCGTLTLDNTGARTPGTAGCW